MAIRVLLAFLWLLPLALAIGLYKWPGDSVDLYVGDRYYIVRKIYIALMLAVFIVLPLAVWTVKRFRIAR